MTYLKTMSILKGSSRVLKVGSDETLGVTATPDSRDVLTAGFAGVHRWNLATGKKVCTYRNYSGHVSWCVACDPKQSLVLAGFGDLTLRLWDYATGKEL